MITEDLFCLSQIGHAVCIEQAHFRRQLFETLEITVPVLVKMQHGNDALVSQCMCQFDEIRKHQLIPDLRRDQRTCGTPAPNPDSGYAGNLCGMDAIKNHVRHHQVHDLFDFVLVSVQINIETAHRPSATQIFEGNGCTSKRDRHVTVFTASLLDVLQVGADPDPALLQLVHIDHTWIILLEKGRPALVQDHVIFFLLHDLRFLDLPQAVCGQFPAWSSDM